MKRSWWYALWMTVAVAVVVGGCGPRDRGAADPVAPIALSVTPPGPANNPGEFYPLAEGNQWSYDRVMWLQETPLGGDPEPPQVDESTVTRQQTVPVEAGGVAYVREVDEYSGGSWVAHYYRQDRAGLYSIDLRDTDRRVAASRPAGEIGAGDAVRRHLARHRAILASLFGAAPAGPSLSPPGGAGAGETTILAYPLHPGAAWTVREDPSFTASVDGRVDGAWRVRVDNVFMGPNDRAWISYNRCGMQALFVHVESIAVDEQGNMTGHIVSEETWGLTGADLGRGGCRL